MLHVLTYNNFFLTPFENTYDLLKKLEFSLDNGAGHGDDIGHEQALLMKNLNSNYMLIKDFSFYNNMRTFSTHE